MYDTYTMKEHICKELEKRTKNGLKTTQDLDAVWKLVDAYKNMLKIDMLQEASEYSHNDDYGRGHSERRRRDSMGRYAREGGGQSYDEGSSYRHDTHRSDYSEAKDRYMMDKHSYRANHSPESKHDMNESLHECMAKLKEELREMMANADTREERDKIQDMIREIGRLA